MFWTIAIIGGLVSLALLGGGGVLLGRGGAPGTGKALPILLLVLGSAVLLATVVGAILTKPEQPVGSTRHEVEIVSRSGSSKQFRVTLRNVETGVIYENIRLYGASQGTSGRCRNGWRNLTPGLRIAAPFTLWRNSDTGARSESPDEAALGREYC